MAWAVLLLTAVLVLHLVEEVRAGFRTRFPLGEMPKWLFVGINAVIYSYCLTTFILALNGSLYALPFAWVLALVMLANGVGRLWIMFRSGAYFPGGYSAIALVAASLWLMRVLAGG